MNAVLQAHDGGRPDQRRNDSTLSESQVSLQRALRTLRAIRQRYVIDRARNSDALSLSVQVAFGQADMCWITSAIEAVEKAIVAGATEAVGPAAQARPET